MRRRLREDGEGTSQLDDGGRRKGGLELARPCISCAGLLSTSKQMKRRKQSCACEHCRLRRAPAPANGPWDQSGRPAAAGCSDRASSRAKVAHSSSLFASTAGPDSVNTGSWSRTGSLKRLDVVDSERKVALVDNLTLSATRRTCRSFKAPFRRGRQHERSRHQLARDVAVGHRSDKFGGAELLSHLSPARFRSSEEEPAGLLSGSVRRSAVGRVRRNLADRDELLARTSRAAWLAGPR